jgi:hypothetical protein
MTSLNSDHRSNKRLVPGNQDVLETSEAVPAADMSMANESSAREVVCELLVG